uniref:Uncharacterized protein n=1 Tax=Leptobrachium leishanense TaxID=445787 RepID=A0A8C5LIZ3_9ANUR
MKYGLSDDPSFLSKSSKKHRKRVSTHIPYTLKKPWAIRYEPITSQDGDPVIIESRCGVLHDADLVSEKEEGENTHAANHQEFPQEKQEIRHLIQDGDANDVPHQQEKGVSSRRAEVGAVYCNHDVCVTIQELDKLLQAPETTFQTAQEEASKLIVCAFQFLHDGKDKRAERQGSGVIPQCPAQRREDGEGRHVIWFLKSPVIRSKRSGQRHLPQRYDEIGQPEEHEGVVVIRLSPVESEQAAGVRAQTGDDGGVKFLRVADERIPYSSEKFHSPLPQSTGQSSPRPECRPGTSARRHIKLITMAMIRPRMIQYHDTV